MSAATRLVVAMLLFTAGCTAAEPAPDWLVAWANGLGWGAVTVSDAERQRDGGHPFCRLTVGDNRVGSVVFRGRRLVSYSDASLDGLGGWLPPTVDWRSACLRSDGPAWLQAEVKRQMTAAWPDFTGALELLNTGASQNGPLEPIGFNIEASPWPGRILRGSITVCPWTGHLLSLHSPEDGGEPLPPPAVSQADALARARTHLRESGSDLAEASGHASFQLDQGAVWLVCFSRGQTEAELRVACVFIDPVTGNVTRQEQAAKEAAKVKGLALALAGLLPARQAPDAPEVTGPRWSDGAPCYAAGGLLVSTSRPTASTPWWRSGHDRWQALTGGQMAWYATDLRDEQLRDAALGQYRFVGLDHGRLIAMSRQDGRVVSVDGVAGFHLGLSDRLYTNESPAYDGYALYWRSATDITRRGPLIARGQGRLIRLATDASERCLVAILADRLRWWPLHGGPTRSMVFANSHIMEAALLGDGNEVGMIVGSVDARGRANRYACRVSLTDGRKRPWRLPQAVSALSPTEWTEGPDGSIYFVGQAPAAGTTVYQWWPDRADPPRPALPAQATPAQAATLGDGSSLLDAACRQMDRWWAEIRADAGWR